MPELPEGKLRKLVDPPDRVTACSVDYAELAVTSNFTFLQGASHPDEMVYQAACRGYRAIAITDRNTLAGVVRAHLAAKHCEIKLLIGARLVFTDAPELLVWAKDRRGYANLCRLLTIGRRRAPKGECELSIRDLADLHEGLLAAVWMNAGGAGASSPRNEFVDAPLGKETGPGTAQLSSAHHPIHAFKDIFGKRLSLALAAPYSTDDESHFARVAEISMQLRIPMLSCNDVHYHDPGRRPLQDVLTCVRHGCTIQQAGYRLFPNGERYLKSPEQMQRIFASYPQAIERAIEIASECTFTLDELKYEYPDEVAPEGKTPMQYLTDLAWEGATKKWPEGIPQKVDHQIRHELQLIEQLKFEAYFLTVYDLVKYARSRGILCQGRGSAANSAVCYCIGVTSVDPNKIDVLFERFISAARNEPPDIDVDFEHERREEVLQYIYEKYGRERAGMTAVLITYRSRSAVRDVGKAMGLGLDLVDHMARQLDWWHRGALSDDQLRAAGLDPADRTIKQVIELTTELLGFPRHLSQHTGGMVMTRGPLCEMVPIENASMEDRTVIEWDKDDIDALGLLKVDCLALGMLTCISKAFKMIERHVGTKARRHEVRKEGTEDGSGTNSDISGSDCVAEGYGTCSSGLSANYENAGSRTVWTDQSDETCSSIDSVEHRGRICTTDDSGLRQVPENGTRLARGTFDSGRNCNLTENDAGFATRPQFAQRSRSCSSGSYSQSGTETETFKTISPATGSLTPSTPSPLTSCLRASVPSCLPKKLELDSIPDEDPAVYDMICKADTIGVFQIESRAQMAMLPRLRPRSFYDLVIEVAIVRPGPIQGDMVHPYLRRRMGLEPVSFPSKELEAVLGKTLGVPLFQEQAMKIAMVAAGFSGAEADQLRRAMAAWRKTERLELSHGKIVRGMIANGYTREFAEQCFNQIKGFGEYGFPESHSASFALLVYVSAWIKKHHPAAFCAALLNSQPMGFYAPAQIVRDAKDHGAEVRGVDVNFSDWDCTLEEAPRHEGTKARSGDQGSEGESAADFIPSPSTLTSCLRASVPPCLSPAVRLGFRQIHGFKLGDAEKISEARGNDPFQSIEEFHRRTDLSVATLKQLAEADAFSSLGLSRRQALWQVLRLKDIDVPVFDSQDNEEKQYMLPLMPLGQEVRLDYVTAGLSLKKHPVALLRNQLKKMRVIPCAELARQKHGTWLRVAGLVLIRQRPGTASGIVFETLEDEGGIANLIIKPGIYDKFRPAARHATLLLAEGRLQKDERSGVIHLLAYRMQDLTEMLNGLWSKSRDFH